MLNQTEFYKIIEEEKFLTDNIIVGGFIRQNFEIFFKNENLNSIKAFLDISKSGTIEIKHSINKRVKTSIPILRLDINGHHHSNPIFEEELIKEIKLTDNLIELMKKYSGYKFTKESHLHYYIEPFRERWAFPPEEFGIEISCDFKENIRKFCDNFNIKAKIIQEGLF